MNKYKVVAEFSHEDEDYEIIDYGDYYTYNGNDVMIYPETSLVNKRTKEMKFITNKLLSGVLRFKVLGDTFTLYGYFPGSAPPNGCESRTYDIKTCNLIRMTDSCGFNIIYDTIIDP